MASLCFSDAAWARKGNKISVETYFGHLLAHFRGVRHAEDDSHDLLHLRIVDPVSASVKRMILNPDFKTVRDTALHERLLLSCSAGMLEDVKSLYQRLKKDSHQVPLQPMAAAASLQGKADVFKYCLQEGAVIDAEVDKASAIGSNVDMLKVLIEAKWRNVKSDQNALDKLLISSIGKGQQQVAFLLDQGARIKPRTFSRASFNPPSGADAATVALLLSRGGEPKDSGALQLAAGRGRLDVVEVLLKAGADIDEIPTNAPGDVMDGWPQTALHQAVAGGWVELVRHLLKSGARIDVRDDQGETALEAATRRGQRGMVDLFTEKAKY